jgi:hypothetical protein
MKSFMRKAVRIRRGGRIALVGLAFVTVARVAVAQDISDILPELKPLPAPASITEGLRPGANSPDSQGSNSLGLADR